MLSSRHSKSTCFNLAIGEPHFLSKHIINIISIVEPILEMGYPQLGGEPELIHEINHLIPEYKYIVVTNGAKQAISAALYAFKQDWVHHFKHKGQVGVLSGTGRKSVYHSAPYWPSFPTLASLMDMSFHSSNKDYMDIDIVTSPNNPDGTVCKDYCPDIWDASYYNPVFPVYNRQQTKLLAQAATFSAAKMIGTSGLRVGWLATNSEEIYKNASAYVEKSTTGVSTQAQWQISSILRHIRLFGCQELFKKATQELINNSLDFLARLDPYIDMYSGAPEGMFAFFKVKDLERFANALVESKVQMIPGKACGMKEDGWYRASLGVSNKTLNETCSALLEKLK